MIKKLTDGGAVSWADRDGLDAELDETLLNVLHWSGLPVRADVNVFVPDAYFEATESHRNRDIIGDPPSNPPRAGPRYL